MLFGKKKDFRPVPIDEIREMNQSGMGDKDIIKNLKARGYSYNEIEKTMLQAVKEGVSERQTEQPRQPMPAMQNPEEDLFMQEFPEELAMPEGSVETPDVIIEELIEGVVKDKWVKFDESVKKLEAEISNVQVDLKQMEQKIEATKKESPTKDYDAKVSEFSEKLEDIDARVGGLEKAFKQFLPSLTRNIESLSKMIHEMKEKQGFRYAEEVRA